MFSAQRHADAARSLGLEMRLYAGLFLFFTLALTTKAALAEGSLESYVSPVDAPPLRLEDVNGAWHDLADYRGEVVLVNFWASWCTPCLQEMPGMQRLADSLSDRPFQVLAVNVAERHYRFRRILDNMGIELRVLLDTDGDRFRSWRGKVLPTSFLLDSNGKIRYQVIGPMEWDSEGVRNAIIELTPDR